MVDHTNKNFLSHCPVPQSGCFANDPDALVLLHSPGVADLEAAVVQEDISRAAEAAMDAGVNKVPLEEAAYTRAIIEPAGQTGIGEGPERGILEPGEVPDLDALRIRIARCAEACGRNALQCPIFRYGV